MHEGKHKKTPSACYESEHAGSGNMPRTQPCFKHINRYWDTRNNQYAAKLKPGEYYVSLEGELITTVLGSCVATCIRETKLCIGGMNHIMLPDANELNNKWRETPVSLETRYGNVAMESLINSNLAIGGKRENLEIKLFGGAALFNFIERVGNKNIEFVKLYLMKEGLNIASEDVGGRRPRKVHYYLSTGLVRVRQLASLHNQTLYEREKEYLTHVMQNTNAGDIELFD